MLKRGIEYNSFHLFFFIELKNELNIGVVVQYLKIEEKEKDKYHLWEDDGVEYLETNIKNFKPQYLNKIYNVIDNSYDIDDWLIIYDNVDLNYINLKGFFEKTIPEKGKCIQSKLNPKEHGCLHFIIESIKNLGIKKKEAEIKAKKEKIKILLKIGEKVL